MARKNLSFSSITTYSSFELQTAQTMSPDERYLTAAEMLSDQGFSLRVVNSPWLNRLDEKWLEETIGDCQTIFALDNHSEYGGLGDHLLSALMLSDYLHNKKLIKTAVEEHPACGTPPEALAYHRLDAKNLVTRVLQSKARSTV